MYPKLFDKNDDINKNKIIETNYNLDTNNNPIDENINDQDDKFTYPKYYKNLKRIYNFYKTKKRGDSPSAKKIYDEVLPDIENTKSLNDLVTKLNDDPDKNNRLIDNLDKNKNKNNINDDDYINEIGEFAKFDKNLTNGAFIKNKLKENKKLKNNKNLLNIIKNVDDEYNNLINGKYCYKCGKEIAKCKCDDINNIFKNTIETQENNEEDDDDLDLDIGGDNLGTNRKINYFEYDSNKSKGILVTNKPKLNSYIAKPNNNLIIYNQKQLNDINKKIMGKDKSSTSRVINNSYINNEFQSNQSNSSLSGVRHNNRYNNNYTSNNSLNYNNESNTLKNKSIKTSNNNISGKYSNKGSNYNNSNRKYNY